MSDIAIEDLGRTHIPAILKIEEEEFAAPWTEEMFQQEVDDNDLSRGLVALIEGKAVGYLVAWFLREHVHLLNIAVSAPVKRRGIASLMLRSLIDLALGEGRKLITLEVRRSNKSAIAFYEVFGFERYGVKNGYYLDNKEDALLFVKYLARPRPGGD